MPTPKTITFEELTYLTKLHAELVGDKGSFNDFVAWWKLNRAMRNRVRMYLENWEATREARAKVAADSMLKNHPYWDYVQSLDAHITLLAGIQMSPSQNRTPSPKPHVELLSRMLH